MEIANLIINGCIFIGLWFIFYYQKSKISSLKTTIDSQKNILDSTQKFIDIFNLDTVEKYVRISEETIKKETDKRVKEAEQQLSKYKDRSNKFVKTFIEQSIKDDVSWYVAVIVMLTSIRPDDREIVISRISESRIKDKIEEMNKEYETKYNPPNQFGDTLLSLITNRRDITGKARIIPPNDEGEEKSF